MKPIRSTLYLGAAALLALPCLAAPSQDAAPEELDRAALEAEFERKLSGCRLVGQFTDDAKPANATPDADSYRIKKISKLKNDHWRFEAVVPFGEREMTLPIALKVEWAGDTPVLTLTDLAIPGMGTFTARILFYGNQYAGTWSSPVHGGHMYGYIVPDEESSEGGGEEGEDDKQYMWDDPRQDGAAESSPVDDLGEDTVHWPSFRGYRARGVAEGETTPETWDLETGENVLWRAPVPGLAHSSPIVWGDRVFVTSAARLDAKEADLTVGLYGAIAPVPDEGPHAFLVMCFDKRTGELVWEQTAHEGKPKFLRHTKGSHAASSPATDGEHVVAFFGTEGLYCYDMQGELLWKKDLGDLDSGYYMMPGAQWGFSSSPVLHGGRVIVQCDIQADSFLAALDADTGEELWRTMRDENPTWSSPTVDVGAERTQVILNGYKHIGGYDLATGEELWKLVGGGDIPVPTPIVAKGHVFIMNAHGRMAPIYAIQTGAEGELEGKAEDEPQMTWWSSRYGNYMQTPIVYGDYLYGCSDGGILGCYDAVTGEEVYRERLAAGGGGFTASAVATDGKLYFTSEDGEVHVVATGRTFDKIAVNDLGETCMASPAISDGVMLWRTRSHLLAIGL